MDSLSIPGSHWSSLKLGWLKYKMPRLHGLWLGLRVLVVGSGQADQENKARKEFQALLVLAAQSVREAHGVNEAHRKREAHKAPKAHKGHKAHQGHQDSRLLAPAPGRWLGFQP